MMIIIMIMIMIMIDHHDPWRAVLEHSWLRACPRGAYVSSTAKLVEGEENPEAIKLPLSVLPSSRCGLTCYSLTSNTWGSLLASSNGSSMKAFAGRCSTATRAKEARSEAVNWEVASDQQDRDSRMLRHGASAVAFVCRSRCKREPRCAACFPS
jgi:hypothetical protein